MIKYLSNDEVLSIHNYIIAEFGGSHGLRDENGLDAAIMRPQSGYYKTIFEQAAALMESLANNHPFIDGNKRIAFFATDIFLRLNGYAIECDYEPAYHHFMELFNKNKFDFTNLLSWIKDNNVKLS
jgi:death-on-curing protein